MNSFKTFCENDNAGDGTIKAKCIVAKIFQDGTNTSWAYTDYYQVPLTQHVQQTVVNTDCSLADFLTVVDELPGHYDDFIAFIETQIPADKRPAILLPRNIYGLHLKEDLSDNALTSTREMRKFVIFRDIGCCKGAYLIHLARTTLAAQNPFISRFKKK
jgi:hypothetical protein